jgi:hypothetical protein
MPTVIRRLRLRLDEGNKIAAVKQASTDTGYSLSDSVRLVQHCESDAGLSDKALAFSWCDSCRNPLSACHCAVPTSREYEPSRRGVEEGPAEKSSGEAAYHASEHNTTQLELWRKIRDLAGKDPGEAKRIADKEIQTREAELLDLWEILVPIASNEGVPFPEGHHQAFRRIIRSLPGNSGTTTLPAGDGDWQDNDTGKVYAEKMIPIRFRACRADADRMAEHACRFYDQIVVMAYRVASGHDIIMAKRKS